MVPGLPVENHRTKGPIFASSQVSGHKHLGQGHVICSVSEIMKVKDDLMVTVVGHELSNHTRLGLERTVPYYFIMSCQKTASLKSVCFGSQARKTRID